MSYVITVDSTDLSEYLIDSSPVAAIERNRDFTPIVSTVDLVFAYAARNQIQVDDEVTIATAANSSYPFYAGYVKEKQIDYDRRAVRVRVRHILSDLEKYQINYGELHSDLVGGISGAPSDQEYIASDNDGRPAVQVLYLIKVMFNIAGLSVYTDGIKDKVVEQITFDLTPRDIEIEHLRLDENMLYAINQETATYYSSIDSDATRRAKYVSFLDFFLMFCSSIGEGSTNKIGFNIGLSSSGTANRIHLYFRDNTAISIDDEDTFHKETDDVEGAEGGYSYNIRFGDRVLYTTTPDHDLDDHKGYTGDGKNALSWYTNLVFMYEKFWDTEGYSLGISSYPTYNLKPAHFLYNKIRSKIADFEVTKWTAPAQIITRAKSCKINLKDRTAEIVEEIE